jgi:transposase
MLLLPKAVKVYVATYPVNLRKSFDGLSNEVRSILGKDPLSGHVFVFVNRRKTQVKLIFWSRGGFTIVTKRLEKGRFTFVEHVHSAAKSLSIDVHELSMLLEGLEANKTRAAARWEPAKTSTRASQAPFSDA